MDNHIIKIIEDYYKHVNKLPEPKYRILIPGDKFREMVKSGEIVMNKKGDYVYSKKFRK